ncbi:hypothetical protein APV28_1064 [Comamonas testosteroni]|nr:hypothetical protein APV28_1064 [Comamonas testosteroni]
MAAPSEFLGAQQRIAQIGKQPQRRQGGQGFDPGDAHFIPPASRSRGLIAMEEL